MACSERDQILVDDFDTFWYVSEWQRTTIVNGLPSIMGKFRERF